LKSEKPKKLKRLKSVNFAMWEYFCLLAFLLILIIEVVFYFVVSTNLESKARSTLMNIGNEVTREVSSGHGDLPYIISSYLDEGIGIYVINTEGEVMLPENAVMNDEKSRIAEMQKRLERLEKGKNVIYSFGDGLNYAVKIDMRRAEPNAECYVLVSYPLQIVRGTVTSLQLYFILLGASALVLAFLISYPFSKKLTGGLKTMSDTAVLLAKGDYTVEFTNVDYTEMAQLSDTLNYVRDEVKKSEDFQREILANVTHDLKTPLTMIKAYASMVKEISGDNPEKRDKHLQVIIDEADRLTGLVNDVLSVSKLQSNIDEINPKVFNLTELVYSIINKFGYLQETQGYSFMLDVDSELYTRADEEKISQVIYNLVGNASNYTGADKTVYISLKLSDDGKRIKFSVRDTGKGIPKENLPDIWNRYYRVKENHSRPVKGTGLGLNIVKAILQNHSFDFGVESEVGKGSTFWVDFPEVPAEINN